MNMLCLVLCVAVACCTSAASLTMGVNTPAQIVPGATFRR